MAARRRRKITWPIVNKDDIPLRNVTEEYLQYHDGLNHSPKTVRRYGDMLGRFADASQKSEARFCLPRPSPPPHSYTSQ